MAYSKCSKCDNTYFEMVENIPAKSNYKLLFIQCSKCGSVVGAMDFYNIGARISELEKKIEGITFSNSTSSINNNINIVNQNISNLFSLINEGFERIGKGQIDKQNSKDTE